MTIFLFYILSVALLYLFLKGILHNPGKLQETGLIHDKNGARTMFSEGKFSFRCLKNNNFGFNHYL